MKFAIFLASMYLLPLVGGFLCTKVQYNFGMGWALLCCLLFSIIYAGYILTALLFLEDM